MKLEEDIRPVTYLKTRSAQLLADVAETRRPVVITQSGRARAVVLDVASYEALRDAALMMRLVSAGEAEVKAGRTVTVKEAFVRARQRGGRNGTG